MDLDETLIDAAWEKYAQRVKYQIPGGCGGYLALQTDPLMANMSFKAAVYEILNALNTQEERWT